MRLSTVLLATALTFTAAQAKAEGYQTIDIGGNFTVGPSETKSVPLDSVRQVRNLVVQAEGLYQDSEIEVMVNGQVKGTIYAPGRDPSYIVTIAEATRSIEFRHRSGGTMRILKVMATVSDWSKPSYPGHGGFYGDKEAIKSIATSTLRQIEILSTFATPEEIDEFLYPIKKNAGMVFVMANAHGNISRQTIQQLHALVDQIDFAKCYLNELMGRESAFDSVVELMTVRETLADMLD